MLGYMKTSGRRKIIAFRNINDASLPCHTNKYPLAQPSVPSIIIPITFGTPISSFPIGTLTSP